MARLEIEVSIPDITSYMPSRYGMDVILTPLTPAREIHGNGSDWDAFCGMMIEDENGELRQVAVSVAVKGKASKVRKAFSSIVSVKGKFGPLEKESSGATFRRVYAKLADIKPAANTHHAAAVVAALTGAKP